MARKLLIGLVLLAALAVILAIFRGPLSLAIMQRAVARNMAADFVAELPDGLHVVLCGAGGPLPDPARSGPCVAVVAGETFFVVDAGSGGARNLARMGLAPGGVDALLLTHFHSDHIDGLGELALLRWAGGAREQPLPVLGPIGVGEVVAGFNAAYRQDARYRVAHHGPETVPPAGAGMEARPFPPPPEGMAAVVWNTSGVKVAAFAVDHAPVSPAVGYRFEYGGRTLLISGDTSRSDAVQREAAGVDLLVHEALSERLVGVVNQAARDAGLANLAKITSDIPDYHTTPLEVAQIAAAAEVGHLLYYHVVPPLPLPGMEVIFLEGVADAYAGDVTVGRDGTMVSLPSGSDAIELSSRP